MSRLTPKQYLSQIRHLDSEINSNLLLIEELKSKALKLGGFNTGDKVQNSKSNNFTNWIDKSIDLEKKIDRQIGKLVDLKDKINREINKMSNPLHRLILINHYILDRSLIEISSTYTYDYSYIKHAHGHALQEFKRCNEELFK